VAPAPSGRSSAALHRDFRSDLSANPIVVGQAPRHCRRCVAQCDRVGRIGPDECRRHAPAIGPGSLILHVSGPFIPYALGRCGRSVVRHKHVIGYWHWELPRLPKDWAVGMEFVHEVWVSSRFCAEAVRHDFKGPVRIIPHLVDVGDTRKSDRTNDSFRVLTMFNMASGFERKNPLATVRAFQRAFGHDPKAHLVVKVLNPSAYPPGMAALAAEAEGFDNITLVTTPLARPEVYALIAGADAVMSLHRAEGFGLLAAEAMLIGVPVIATDWSATTDFVTAETGLPIPYRLVPALDPQGSYHDPDQVWADPDVAAAAQALLRLRSDRSFAAGLARTAKAMVGDMLSAERYAEHIRAALGG
jgi:glycosyltransferase involved in cell wall biosynthesis